MSVKKAIMILAMFGMFPGSVAANEEYQLVKIWPEFPQGWHFYRPMGVAVDKAGNVYIGDTGNYRIKKFDSAGRFILQWGSAGEDEGQFGKIARIKVDSSGIVWVVEWPRIQKFTSYGQFIETWERKGPGVEEFEGVVDVAVDSSGNVFAIALDFYPHQKRPRPVRVEKFTLDGNLITHWGSIGYGDGQFVAP
ncbi:MAG: hypothetical protein PVJ86_14175, partial [Phycisphaerales bacterium]